MKEEIKNYKEEGKMNEKPKCKYCKVDMEKVMVKIKTDGTPLWKWVCPKCKAEGQRCRESAKRL